MTGFEKTVNCLKKPWVITVFIVMVILSYQYVDRTLATYFYHLDLRSNFKILKVLTCFGVWFLYLGLFFALGLFFRFVNKNEELEKNSWFLFGCIFIPNLINFILKVSLSRARPELLFMENLYGFYWFKLKDLYWSFPSGHAVTIVAFVSGLGVLVPKYFYLFLVMALLVAATRVMLYHHYLSDVLVGFYYSMLVVGLLAHFVKRKK